MSKKDEYAREVLRAGRDLGITARGIVIAFATVSVECDWIMYANVKVPESLNLPHERVGSDGKSVGLFQQQVVWGNGAWWWGDAATCMDPYKSAVLFFERLKKRDYNHGDMGAHAQAIQGSAFPDRYATRMAEAQRLYDRIAGGTVPSTPNGRPPYNAIENWTENQSSRGGVAIDCVFIHTQEPAKTPSMNHVNDGALNLSNFIKSTEGGPNPVSYHTVASQNLSDKGVTVVYCADTDNKSYSVGNSNPRSLNYCFGGSFSGWTTEQWMQQSGAIDAIAWEIVSDCIKYGLTTKDKRPPVDWSTNYAHNPPVISDHRYCSVKLRDGNNHTDVDNGRGTFPWKYFEGRLNEYADIQLGITNTPAPPSPVPVKQFPKDYSDRDLLVYVAEQLGAGRDDWGEDGDLGKNAKGQRRTLRAGLAALIRKVGA